MKLPTLHRFSAFSRKGREALRRVLPDSRRGTPMPLPGRFQPYNHTLPNRYPWLFEFAAAHLGSLPGQRILSFGCSRGDEVFALRNYFPQAAIKGIDIDRGNIDGCQARAREQNCGDTRFAAAATTQAEPDGHYDAIFCLAVLCHGDLASTGARRSDPLLYFVDFERMVTDFARCVKPGGLLLLHTTNFRFSDTAVSAGFDTVLEADPTQLATDAVFDRDNRLIEGVRYRAVGFCKHGKPARQASLSAAAG
jgi:2-polyprenyl-3-methyl-5-hydroxy-6-metoxy-1,4-benzoquinol methylase